MQFSPRTGARARPTLTLFGSAANGAPVPAPEPERKSQSPVRVSSPVRFASPSPTPPETPLQPQREREQSIPSSVRRPKTPTTPSRETQIVPAFSPLPPAEIKDAGNSADRSVTPRSLRDAETAQRYRAKLPDALAEFSILEEVARGPLGSDRAWVVATYQRVSSLLEEVIYKHLKGCSLCRTESEFQIRRTRGQGLSARHLASLCDVSQRELVETLQESLTSERNHACGVAQVNDLRQQVRQFEEQQPGGRQFIEHRRTTRISMAEFHVRVGARLAQLEQRVHQLSADWSKFFEVEIGARRYAESKRALSGIWGTGVPPLPRGASRQRFARSTTKLGSAVRRSGSKKPGYGRDSHRAPGSPLGGQVDDDPHPADDEAMRVVGRLRPLLDFESQRNDRITVHVQRDGRGVQFLVPEYGGKVTKQAQLQLHQAFPDSADQEDFFQKSGACRLLDLALNGYVSTIFAYGQTGSGKTHTMSGPDESVSCQEDDDVVDAESVPPLVREVLTDIRADLLQAQGLLSRVIKYLYRKMDGILFRKNGSRFVVRFSSVEIYNEHVQDLLRPKSDNLPVREVPGGNGFAVEGLVVRTCATMDEVLLAAAEAIRNRKVSPHAMNKDSSRSHAMFTIDIDRIESPSQPTGGVGYVIEKHGRVILVDLAGSERLKKTKQFGENLTETSYINKSLFALSNVISHLSSGGSVETAQYRDSKLTKLLMDSLTGTGLTLMIATLSPSEMYMEETANTLFFASKAANIRRKPVKPAAETASAEAFRALREENRELRQEVQSLQSRVGSLTEEAKYLYGLLKEVGVPVDLRRITVEVDGR